ncbi:MAG: phosphatase PAP2 family protein [Sulfuricurvum sp.]
MRTRFDNQHLSGLPLTLASTVFLAIVLLLTGIVEDVVEQDFIVQFDHWIAASMAQAHTASVVSVFYAITMLGSPIIIVPLWIIALIALYVLGNRFWAFPLFISFIGSISMVTLSKYGFARPRPMEALFVLHSPSFPSGHSTLAMSFYAVCFYLWWRRTAGWNGQFWILFAGMSFVALLSGSRIIIGVHYVSDVLAGLLLGSLWFIIAISLYEWLNLKHYINFRSDNKWRYKSE